MADSETTSTSKSSARLKKKAAKNSDFFSLEDDEPTTEKTVASAKMATNSTSSKRNQKRQGVDFREDAEPTEDNTEPASGAPKRLPDDDSISASSVKKRGQAIRQVKAEASEKNSDDASSNTELDPFADEVSQAIGNQSNKTAPAPSVDEPATETEDPVAEKQIEKSESPFEDEKPATKEQKPQKDEPATKLEDDAKINDTSDIPGKAKVYSDKSNDSTPPRSKRARQNATKNSMPRDLDSNPFETEPPTSAEATQTQDPPEKKVTRDPLSAPKERRAPDESISFPDLDVPSTPAVTPDASSTDLDSNPRSNRPNSNRKQPAPPAQLTDEPNAGFLNETPPKTRNSQQKPSEGDKPATLEMVGDGTVGEASQRGIQQPRVSIEKVAQQQAVLDQPFVYSIIVRNTGSVDAHNLVIEDRIPKGTELVGTAPQAELAGKRLIWNHLVLKPNEEKKISIKVIPKQEGPVGSVARVYFATEVSAEIVVAAPQLEFTVKAPSEVRIGQHFDLVFTLKNIGTVDANNIVVRDLVPEELKHEAGSDIECPIGKMAPQESREIVLPVTAARTGTVVNKAILTADSGVKKNLDSSINVIGEVLVLTRTGHNRVYVERSTAFTNTVRNDGNRLAEKVRISEVVPAGLQFETASDGGRYDANLKAVVWTLGPLAPGADKTLTVNYVPKETGTHSTKITATGNAGSTASIQSTVDVYGKPELQMETLSATGAVTIGDRITSKFQLNNTGTAAANNVQLRIKLPRELKLISVNGAKYQQKDNVILFESIDELPPRSKAAYELVLEPVAEADAQIGLEISAAHLKDKPGRRVETIQIARDPLK
jgi:uncharacterized repeat protein (TIGR01451 family)